MRNLTINKRLIYGLNYAGKDDVVDAYGYKTGEQKITYGNEYSFRANKSGAKGNSILEAFGTDLVYDKVILLSLVEFKALGITENSVFFIDKLPEYTTNGEPLYDYKVERIADTLNEVLIAVSKVRSNG